MAGIDKTYTKSFKEYSDLKDWAKQVKFKCPNGMILDPYNSVYDLWKEEDFDGRELAVMNTSNALDYFLIKYCPFQFVQDRMKSVYDEEYYNSIENGTSEYDKFTKEGKYGKHCKVIKKPTCMTKTPIGYSRWFVQPTYETNQDLWYNEDEDVWLWSCELGEANTNVCWKHKSLKSVIRHILKWKLPIGTILCLKSRYIGIEWEIKITK